MNKLLTLFLLVPASIFIAACDHSHESDDQAAFVEIAQAAARGSDRVTVEEVAEWLIEERQDFVLVDVRSAADFEKGQISDAQNIPIAEIVTSDSLATLPTDRKIVVYSNGSENAAKAEVMLRLAGFDAHLLAGGYNAWNQSILNPDITAEELDGESLKVTAQRAYSCYFVGERSDLAAKRNSAESAPFVPPVFTEEEELQAPPAGSGEESC